MNKNLIYNASFLVALSAVLYGFLGYLGTSILQENFSIEDMLFWRFFIATIWIGFFTFKNFSPTAFNGLNKKIVILMFLLGAIGYAASSGFYFVASHYTGTGLAMVIFFSYPIMIALVSWWLEKSFDVITLATLILIVIGLILLRGSGAHPINLLGIFYGVLAAAGYALYLIGSKKFSRYKINSNILTLIVCLGCSVILCLYTLFKGTFQWPTSLKVIADLLLLGIMATAIPIQLMLVGLRQISSVRASIISVLEPLVTVLVGVVALHEEITHSQMLGAFIILMSALLIQFQKEV